MCLAIPARVIELRGPDQVVVDLDGVRRLVSRELIDAVEVGDYLIVHVGYALSKLDENEARRTLELLAQGSILPVVTRTPDRSPTRVEGSSLASPLVGEAGSLASPVPLAGEGSGVRE